ncbi:hypothetical protein TNCV_4662151 [Trichonephila clavipes]|uniref:Uncharacterized protein n=1 Tax=Trichonephila clavipes TaxID=2585209 RepID=A0A8X6VIZ5_TRICX|nr:hypothetical protein TNCV_4662151 [Trichonephila clavipes]
MFGWELGRSTSIDVIPTPALDQRGSVVGFCYQRLMGGSTAMETEQMSFFVEGIHKNNNPRSLLERTKHMGHWFGVVFPNFFRQHSLITIS